MGSNQFAPPKSDVAITQLAATRPKRTIFAFCFVVLAFFAVPTYANIRDGVGLLLVLRPVAIGSAVLSLPFAIAAIIRLGILVTRQGGGQPAFWSTVKLSSWLLGGLIALVGIGMLGLEISNAIYID